MNAEAAAFLNSLFSDCATSLVTRPRFSTSEVKPATLRHLLRPDGRGDGLHLRRDGSELVGGLDMQPHQLPARRELAGEPGIHLDLDARLGSR